MNPKNRTEQTLSRILSGFGKSATTMRAAVAAFLACMDVAFAQDVPGASVIGIATLPRDLSPWGMFLNADIVVKAVMIGLAFASVLTWTIWFAKAFELLAARRRLHRAIEALNDARSLADVMTHLNGSGGDVA